MVLPGLPRKPNPSVDLPGFSPDVITVSQRQPDGTMRHCAPTAAQVENFWCGRPSIVTFKQSRHLT